MHPSMRKARRTFFTICLPGQGGPPQIRKSTAVLQSDTIFLELNASASTGCSCASCRCSLRCQPHVRAELRLDAMLFLHSFGEKCLEIALPQALLQAACADLHAADCGSAEVTRAAVLQQREIFTSYDTANLAMLPIQGFLIDALKRRWPHSPRARVPLLLMQSCGLPLYAFTALHAPAYLVFGAVSAGALGIRMLFHTLQAVRADYPNLAEGHQSLGAGFIRLSLAYMLGRAAGAALVGALLGMASDSSGPKHGVSAASLALVLRLALIVGLVHLAFAFVVLVLRPLPRPPTSDRDGGGLLAEPETAPPDLGACSSPLPSIDGCDVYSLRHHQSGTASRSDVPPPASTSGSVALAGAEISAPNAACGREASSTTACAADQ